MTEVTQMKFLMPLVEFTKLYWERDADVMERAVLKAEACTRDS
jgi:hypothetical protein